MHQGDSYLLSVVIILNIYLFSLAGIAVDQFSSTY